MQLQLETVLLVGGVLLLLMAATAVVQFLKRQPEGGTDSALVKIFDQRIRVWWMMWSILAAAFLFSGGATGVIVFLFFLLSFWALREFITLTPTRLGDHRALFWVFFCFTPLQFVLIGMENYGLYSVLIPVYAFLFIPARVAMAGDYKRFQDRTATIQAGLMICVYCFSYTPALLTLDLVSVNNRELLAIAEEIEAQELVGVPITDFSDDGLLALTKGELAALGDLGVDPELIKQITTAKAERQTPDKFAAARLLFFFVIIVQMSDVFQYGCGKLFGRRAIAPSISPGKTWEGLLGGGACTMLLGTAMYWATPFDPWEAAGMSLVIVVMGFGGGMTMSAIKRDRGVRDYGTLVEGHGGVLDRIDSICFAAPVFFHLTRYYFSDIAG
jgi:phosphatidate cytidylyltransferase